MRAFRGFRFQVAARLLLAGGGLFVLFLFLERHEIIPALAGGVASLYGLVSLFRYVDRSNRGLATFLRAVRYNDFTLSAGTDRLGSSFTGLNDAFRDVIAEFQRAREEKEEQFRYLQTVVQHIGIGLIALRADGTVDLLNNAAKRLLRIAHLRRLGDLPAELEPLVREIETLRPGEKKLLKIDIASEPLQISLAAAGFKRRDQVYKLVSLQNIQTELEEKEAEAWQSLTRVLTHEIMNSLTPISSLAATAVDLLSPEGEGTPQDLDSRTGDIRQALQTIDKRSRGLMHFVEAYRNMTIIPKPRFRVIPASELIGHVAELMRDKLARQGISWETRIEPESIELTADPDLIGQVLINLILNAMEALAGRSAPRIEVTAALNAYGRVLLTVSDNGPGIEAQVLEKIFIPFYSTKKDGSGIGLSFSRQVMRLHHGAIHVHSLPGRSTTFTLRF